MKVLIIRLSSIGDIVLAQPVCAALKSAFPDCEISFLTKAMHTDIVKAFGNCDKIITYEKTAGFHLRLRREHFDLVLDLHAKMSSRLLAFFCKAQAKYTYQKKHFQRRLIVCKLSKRSIPSVVDLYLSALAKSIYSNDIDFDHVRPPQLAPQVDLPEVFQQIVVGARAKKLVALFPGAAHQTKIYPVASWIKLIEQSPEHYEFVLLGSQNERYLCKPIMQQVGSRCHDLCGQYGMADLIAVLDACNLLLSNDSGPMHLGAALGIPQVAIFGSTHPRLGFSPLNAKSVIMCANLDCQPCSLHGLSSCPKGHFNCMHQILPEDILSSMKSIEGLR